MRVILAQEKAGFELGALAFVAGVLSSTPDCTEPDMSFEFPNDPRAIPFLKHGVLKGTLITWWRKNLAHWS